MASKRHRTLKPARTSHDKMAVAHRHRREEVKLVELQGEISPRTSHCDELFHDAEVNPVCPVCGQTIIRRTQ